MLLATGHTMFRQGLAAILGGYGAMEVVAEVPNDEEALGLARELSPDVVVVQVQMPFERTKETLSAMRAFEDPPKVIIVTMFENPRYVRDLTGAGANAYLLKTSSAEHLVAAVRAAVLDPKRENAVVGMPEGMLERAEGARTACCRPGTTRGLWTRPAQRTSIRPSGASLRAPGRSCSRSCQNRLWSAAGRRPSLPPYALLRESGLWAASLPLFSLSTT